MMRSDKTYKEVIEFIASSSPQNVIAFRSSEEAKARVAGLIFREKTEVLSDDEKAELDLCKFSTCSALQRSELITTWQECSDT